MFRFLIDLINSKTLFPKGSFPGGNGLVRSLWLLLVFTVFSGAIRKWVFDAGALSNAIFLFQLLLPLLFFWLVKKSPLPSLSNAPAVWPIYLFYLVLIALNPMNQTIFHGVFGLLLHTGYWLIWLAYLQKGPWMEIEKLVPLLVFILLIEFFLASAQYALPGTHFLNQYASGADNDAVVGDAVRVSGTFSYLGGFQVMVPIFACLAWFLMLRKGSMNLIIPVILLGFFIAFMTGSRGAVGFYGLYILTAIVLTRYLGGRIVKLAGQGVLILSVLFFLLPSFSELFIRSYDNFMSRVENSDELDQRIAGGFEELIYFRGHYPVFGVGLGATYQGANAIFGTSNFVKEYGGYESEPARIVLEGGFVLYLFNLIMILSFLKQTRNLPFLAKAFFLVIYFNSMVTFNVFQGVFYVFGIMLVDRGYYLRNLEKNIFPSLIKIPE